MVDAIKEGFDALANLGVTLTPPKNRLARHLPTWLLARTLRKGFASERAEIIMAAHANAAKDEMEHLYGELRATLEDGRAGYGGKTSTPAEGSVSRGGKRFTPALGAMARLAGWRV